SSRRRRSRCDVDPARPAPHRRTTVLAGAGPRSNAGDVQGRAGPQAAPPARRGGTRHLERVASPGRGGGVRGLPARIPPLGAPIVQRDRDLFAWTVWTVWTVCYKTRDTGAEIDPQAESPAPIDFFRSVCRT